MKLSSALSFLVKGLLLVSTRAFTLDDPASYNHKTLKANNNTYHYVEEGPQDAPLLVICHGFPESWFMYKHQISHFSQLGYRVVALDMLGYGETDAPGELLAYTYKNLTLGLKDFVKELGQESAVFMGHDWGSTIVWQLALAHPEVVNGLMSICVPFYGPMKFNPVDLLQYVPSLNYLFSIAASDVASMDLNRDMLIKSFLSKNSTTLRKISHAPYDKDFTESVKNMTIDRTPVISTEDTTYLLNQFTKHGLRGPTNYYRATPQNQAYLQEAIKPILSKKMNVPALFIRASDDMVNDFGNENDEYNEKVTTKEVKGGHWIHITHKDEVNKLMADWLKSEKDVLKPKSQ